MLTTFPTRHSSQNKPKLRHATLELQAQLSETPDEQQEATLLDGARDEDQGTLTRFVKRGMMTLET